MQADLDGLIVIYQEDYGLKARRLLDSIRRRVCRALHNCSNAICEESFWAELSGRFATSLMQESAPSSLGYFPKRPTRSDDAPHAFVGFLWFTEIFGYMLDFSARNHQTNEHIFLRLERVIPRVLEYFEVTGGATYLKGSFYSLWEWCIIIWWWCVVVPISILIQESGLEPLIVDGCVVIYKGADGHWWIQTVDGQPDIRISGRYGTAEELYGLNNQQRAALRGDDRPSREDDNETMRQQEEDGEQERVDKAKAKVANSHMDREKNKPFIDGILHNGPLLP
ncbi:unnamed protein product [Vitrella brassicaformis CCMP3155]|uniref:Uncharacterized protein n=1 Tax=Vitrella brassicaformis (strain CCMP3155) TaxID=1169540 RepID=A0A0G4EGZ6_VITBC|nr:unnamed protein product [Vitrella brassicaformis CCMP3155]|eukprot:CEL94639.1 unnamed protein product [Vitrella brassicaformis CCMP3155]